MPAFLAAEGSLWSCSAAWKEGGWFCLCAGLGDAELSIFSRDLGFLSQGEHPLPFSVSSCRTVLPGGTRGFLKREVEASG